MTIITLNDIARQAGVSPQTVARVLSGTNKENRPSSIERAQKIRELARQLNYRPNAAARAMNNRQTQNIGVLVAASHHDPFTANSVYFFILGVNDVLEAAGYITSVVRVDEVEHQLDIRSRAAQEVVFDGVIAVGSIPVRLRDDIESMFGNVIWLDTNVDLARRCLIRHELNVGRMIGQAIIERGYKRALWVGRMNPSPTAHHSHQDRYAGLQQALASSDVTLDHLPSIGQWQDQMRDEFEKYLGPETAVVANETNCAQLAIRGGMSLGLQPGKDYGLVACDLTPNVLSVWPDITHVTYDRYDAGRQAAKMMLEQISESEQACYSQQLESQWCEGSTLPTRHT